MQLIKTCSIIVSLVTLSASPGTESAIPDLYKVMGVILIVWLGLAFLLFRLDRKIARLEKEIKNLNGRK